jgi:predicted phage terminase large subunit-like protein
MDVQSVMDSDEYKTVFPKSLLLQKGMQFEGRTPKRTSDYFEMSDPAQLGFLKTVGVGGGLTGFGFTRGIIDDPTKNREEADSETHREAVWKWYTSTFSTRQNTKDAGICLTLTRWHEDDLAGRLLEQAEKDPGADKWTVLTMPAIAEDKPANRNDKRKPGEALWPAKYPVSFLEQRKKADSRDWSALYQQSPYTEGGSILKKHWWKYYKPHELPRFLDEVIISVDAAFKDFETSDFVVMQVWGRKGANKYLVDQIKEKLGFVETIKALGRLTMKYPKARAKLIEDKANGPAIIDALKTKISGLIPIEPQGSKVARAQAVAPQVESGNVYLPLPEGPSDWVSDFIDECAKFPRGKHDDQVDACSQALFRLQTNEGLDIRALTHWE